MNDTTAAAGGIQAIHQAELAAGRFTIQRCTACGRHQYYPRELCSHCGAATLELVAPQGGGTVYATTTVRRKAEAGGDFNVALIDLDEGVRLMSRVEGLAADAVSIGLRVRARVQVSDGRGVVVFDPLSAGGAR